MSFVSPVWLPLIFPWTVLAAYLLWGSRPQRPVSFLQLWSANAAGRPIRRRAQPPALAVVCALLAALIGIAAAAGPRMGELRRIAPIAIVVDRGIAGSARVGGVPRCLLAARNVAPKLRQNFGDGPIDLYVLPRVRTADSLPIRTTADRWLDEVARVPASAAGASAESEARVRRLLATDVPAIVMLTDRKPAVTDQRLVYVPLTREVDDWRIARLSVRRDPTPQAMVVVERRGAPAGAPSLSITTQNGSAEKRIQNPGAYFFDLPSLGEWVEARISTDDAQAANSAAWVAQTGAWPAIDSRGAVPPAVQRMIAVYSGARPAAANSDRLIVAAAADAPPLVERSIWLAAATGVESAQADHAMQVSDMPVTAGVDWARVGELSPPGGEPPPGFRTIVRLGSRTIFAIRERPARQAWVPWGVQTRWPSDPSFVVFWTNLLDWVGGGGEHYGAAPIGEPAGEWTVSRTVGDVRDPSPAWWPGLYRNGAGRFIAVNASGDIDHDSAGESPWPEVHRAVGREGGNISGWLDVLALGLVATASVLWKRGRAARV